MHNPDSFEQYQIDQGTSITGKHLSLSLISCSLKCRLNSDCDEIGLSKALDFSQLGDCYLLSKSESMSVNTYSLTTVYEEKTCSFTVLKNVRILF